MVHCAQWNEEAITASDMENMQAIYDETNVRSVLLKLNGGVTSAAVRQAVTQLDAALKAALSSFKLNGRRSEPELQGLQQALDREADSIRKIVAEVSSSAVAGTATTTNLLRVGAPKDFNMKCYKASLLPQDPVSFANMGSEAGINCAHDMLMWIRNEAAHFSRYDPPAGRSKPEYGTPGMHPECFLLLEKNLKSSDGMMNVFDYLQVSLFCPLDMHARLH